MNDEIKEILDKLYLDFEKAGLTVPEYSDLRDYITNLQEENDDLKNRIENAVADCNLRIQENTEWKLENERLNNIINEAIKYIKKNYYEIVYKTKGTMESDLLEILGDKGEDNE